MRYLLSLPIASSLRKPTLMTCIMAGLVDIPMMPCHALCCVVLKLAYSYICGQAYSNHGCKAQNTMNDLLPFSPKHPVICIAVNVSSFHQMWCLRHSWNESELSKPPLLLHCIIPRWSSHVGRASYQQTPQIPSLRYISRQTAFSDRPGIFTGR